MKIHPWNLTWNLKSTRLKRKIIFQTSIFRFHVKFQGSIEEISSTHRWGSQWFHTWSMVPNPPVVQPIWELPSGVENIRPGLLSRAKSHGNLRVPPPRSKTLIRDYGGESSRNKAGYFLGRKVALWGRPSIPMKRIMMIFKFGICLETPTKTTRMTGGELGY